MFIYFTPRVDGTPFSVPAHLNYATDRGASFQTREVLAGPEGSGPGWLCRFSSVAGVYDTRDLKLDPKAQSWARVWNPDGQLGCWVGRWNDDKLNPSIVERPKLLDSHRVTLADGSVWNAAIARGFDVESERYYTPLPHTLAFDGSTGKWRPASVAREYRKFLDLAHAYADAHAAAVAEERTSFEFPEIDHLAIAALTANYRVSHAELGLFEDVYTVTARDALVHCALDYPTIKKWVEKKTERDAAGAGT
jgi:hypothetical protein